MSPPLLQHIAAHATRRARAVWQASANPAASRPSQGHCHERSTSRHHAISRAGTDGASLPGDGLRDLLGPHLEETLGRAGGVQCSFQLAQPGHARRASSPSLSSSTPIRRARRLLSASARCTSWSIWDLGTLTGFGVDLKRGTPSPVAACYIILRWFAPGGPDGAHCK